MQFSLSFEPLVTEVQICEACQGEICENDGFMKYSTQSTNESGRPTEIEVKIYHAECLKLIRFHS